MHGFALFFSVFGVIFVAELPDKTALAALVLATRHRALPVLFGAGSALTVQSVVSVAAGRLFAMLPEKPVHVVAALLFLLSAVLMWRRHDEDDEHAHDGHERGFSRTFGLVFAVVFVAEWGDLTQIATAALAAQYRAPLVVFGGATLALWTVAAIAVFVGNRASRLLDPNVTKRVAAVVFAIVGAGLLLRTLGWIRVTL